MQAFRKKVAALLAVFPILLCLVLFLCDPQKYSAQIFKGVSLWAVSVLPATFPFLFLTALLSRMKAFGAFSRRLSPVAGACFNVSGTGGCIFVLSVLSGYPVGARTILDCHERGLIPKDEVFRLACLSSTSGPMFLVGVVGGSMLRSPRLGWILLLSHLLGVLTVSFILRFTARGRRSPVSVPIKQQDAALYDSLYSSILSILCVGGSIALFSCFGEMLCTLFYLPDNSLLYALVKGITEMTTGCALLTKQPTPFTLALCCFFVTFGGLCVLCQQLAFLNRTGVKTLPFVGVKILQGVLAAVICFFLVGL